MVRLYPYGASPCQVNGYVMLQCSIVPPPLPAFTQLLFDIGLLSLAFWALQYLFATMNESLSRGLSVLETTDLRLSS